MAAFWVRFGMIWLEMGLAWMRAWMRIGMFIRRCG